MLKPQTIHRWARAAFVFSALAPLGCGAEVVDDLGDEATEISAEAITADEAIQVERAALFTMSKYGGTWNNYQFHLALADIDYDKQVAIYARSPSGTWFDIPASYERPAGGNKQIWGAYTNEDVTQFVVRYTVLGQTYWDNNGGSNYTLVGQGQNLYHGINVLAGTPSPLTGSSSSLGVWVYVRNIAYSKQVNVVYTTDGWATVKTAALGYQNRDYYGYGSAASPNDAGIELWSGSLDVGPSASRVDYAVSYTVNGQAYWDNNHGANYVVYRQ